MDKPYFLSKLTDEQILTLSCDGFYDIADKALTTSMPEKMRQDAVDSEVRKMLEYKRLLLEAGK